MYKVKRRFIKAQNKAPCVGFYLYSISNGRSWMTEKEYREFKKRVFNEQW